MPFASFDVFVAVALVLGSVHGRSKGFAWQLSGIATLILGYLGAAAGSKTAATFFPDTWPADLKQYAAWATLYAVVSILVYGVTLSLKKKIRELQLEELDRRFGGLLGALKAAAIVTIVTLVAVAASERAQEIVRESVSGPVLARIAVSLSPLLPERIAHAVERCASRIDAVETSNANTELGKPKLVKPVKPEPAKPSKPAKPEPRPTKLEPKPLVKPVPQLDPRVPPPRVAPKPRPAPEPERPLPLDEDLDGMDGLDDPRAWDPDLDDPLLPPRPRRD